MADETLFRIDDDRICAAAELIELAAAEGFSADDLETASTLDVGDDVQIAGSSGVFKIERVERCPNNCEDGVAFIWTDVDDGRDAPCPVCCEVDADEDGPYCVRDRRYV